MLRVVADLGNSRLKWARLAEDGSTAEVVRLPLDDESAWDAALHRWSSEGPGAASPPFQRWLIASVNRPALARLLAFLAGRQVTDLEILTSATEIPVHHRLGTPGSTGVDRALAVLAAQAGQAGRGPGQVVACGTALTIERIDDDGIWRGGAIATGWNLMAQALHVGTDQLPRLQPVDRSLAFGDSTRPAIEAGLYWGAVGIVRELLAQQSRLSPARPWIILCGGDAPAIARGLDDPAIQVVPDLVLHGLAVVARGREAAP